MIWMNPENRMPSEIRPAHKDKEARSHLYVESENAELIKPDRRTMVVARDWGWWK